MLGIVAVLLPLSQGRDGTRAKNATELFHSFEVDFFLIQHSVVVNLFQSSYKLVSNSFYLFFNVLTIEGSLELLIMPFCLHHLVSCFFFFNNVLKNCL